MGLAYQNNVSMLMFLLIVTAMTPVMAVTLWATRDETSEENFVWSVATDFPVGLVAWLSTQTPTTVPKSGSEGWRGWSLDYACVGFQVVDGLCGSYHLRTNLTTHTVVARRQC